MSGGQPKEVCIVLLTGLGDVINGLPLVNALKDAHPEWRITWIAEPVPAQILRPHPAVDEVIVYRKSRGWRGVVELRSALRGRRFDLTLNLNVYFKSLWPTLLSGAPRRIGFGRGRARDGVWLAATETLAPSRQRHNVDAFLAFAAHLGVPAGEPEWRIPLTAAEREEQQRFFAPLADRPVVAIVPAAAQRSRSWFPERYAEVVDALHERFGFHTLLVGGPGERETAVAREISARARKAPVWGMGGPVRDLVWQLSGSAFVIAPDTGPLHLARAFGVPVVGLYGLSDPRITGPYRYDEAILVDAYSDGEPEPHPRDYPRKPGRMERITTADVLARVERVVARYLTPPSGL